MKNPKSIAAAAARRFVSKLPLPIATPVQLRRWPGAPMHSPLTGRTVALTGRGVADARVIVEWLEAAGARVTSRSQGGSVDIVLHGLPASANEIDLLNLHADMHEAQNCVGNHGRILVYLASSHAQIVTDAMHGFVRSLAREKGRKGITVNAVVCNDAVLAAPVLGFLATDRASYISGQSIHLAAGGSPAANEAGAEVAVVTGSAQGIGASIARMMASAGYRVALMDLPSKQEMGLALSKELGGESAGIAFVPCDVTNLESVEKGIERARTLSPTGVLSVVVNNAGITRDKTFGRMTADEWDAVMAVNLQAAMQVTRTSLPCLAAGARIVNMASVTGFAGNFGQVNYATAKGGLIGFTRQMAGELEGRGIAVTAVAPGLIETAMTARMPFISREIGKQMTSLVQMGTCDDVAMAVEFVARQEAWPLRGQVLRVDGGMFFGP